MIWEVEIPVGWAGCTDSCCRLNQFFKSDIFRVSVFHWKIKTFPFPQLCATSYTPTWKLKTRWKITWHFCSLPRIFIRRPPHRSRSLQFLPVVYQGPASVPAWSPKALALRYAICACNNWQACIIMFLCHLFARLCKRSLSSWFLLQVFPSPILCSFEYSRLCWAALKWQISCTVCHSTGRPFLWRGWAPILRVRKQKLIFCYFPSLHKYSFSCLCASTESPQIHNSFLKADDFDLEFLMLFQNYFFQL